MSFRKVSSIAVAVIMLLALLSACGSGSNISPDTSAASADGTTAGTSGEVKETAAPKPVTLQIMMMYDWFSPRSDWEWGDDPVTKKITEVTGVTLEMVSPAGKGDEKALMMLMAGNYPDIMWMDRNSVLQKYIDTGALYSIDELAGKYNYPNIVGDYIPQNVVNYLKSADGQLYLIPNWFNEHGELYVGNGFMYREDIYKALGSPKLDTLDDFTNFLRKVKESNMSFEGQKVYPVALDEKFDRVMFLGNLWGEKIMNNMYYDETDNTVKFAMRSKGTYEAAKWWNMLYREGLADPENLTYKTQQRVEALNKGKYAAYIGPFWDAQVHDPVLEKVNPDAHYVTINLPIAVQGVKPHFEGYSVVGWNANVITKNCKDPEAAIRFYNYYMSPEGQRLTFSGAEGISMEKVAEDGRGILKQEVYDGMMLDWDATSTKYGCRLLDLAQYSKYNWEFSMETGLRKANRSTVEAFNWDGTPFGIIQLEASADEGKKFANIFSVLNTTGLTKILTSETEADFEKEYNKLLSDFENMGLKDVEKKWTELYLAIVNK